MMELNHTEQMALFEGLMDAEYRKLKPQFPRCRFKKEFSRKGFICTSRTAGGTVMWRSALASTSTAGGMSGMAGTMTCAVGAIIRRRTIRWQSFPGICKRFISPCWNSRSAALMSCFQPSGSNRLCGHDTCSAVWWSRLRRGRRFHPDRRE